MGWVHARSVKKIILFAVTALVFAACGGGDRMVFTDADMGSELTLDAGDEFRIELGSNPSTGYSWVITSAGLPSGVELVDETYVAPDTDLVGAPGFQSFTFEATEQGAGVLRLEYLRLFEDLPVPERVAEFIVRIDDAPWPPVSTSPPPATTTATAPDPGEEPVSVNTLFDGEGARDATLTGFVVWDATGARVCDVLMESFPPQCGWAWIVVANPGALDVEFDETQGVRWTANAVLLTGHYDGQRFILPDGADLLVPTAGDEALIAAFFEFVGQPGGVTAAALPLAPAVSLGLAEEIVKVVGAAELAGPEAWTIDRADFRAWAGPFSVLDFANEPAAITIGSYARCAAPPVAAPAGFDGHRRLSIQPTEATSCLEWWTVDFFLSDEGLIEAITLDLFEP